MERFYCNCCGCDFSEQEGRKHHIDESAIECPMCGAYYDEEDPDEPYIEKYND